MGSISELETQLLIAVDLGYLDKDSPIFGKLEQASKLVSGLQKRPILRVPSRVVFAVH